jgi:hypothetical protein
MTGRLRWLGVLLGVLLALIPAAAFAADETDEDGLLLRINGPVTIAAGEVEQNVIVISDDVVVDGAIEGSLFVIDGDAVINGSVADDVTVVSGSLTLGSTATVRNVSVFDGTLTRQQGATVTGDISERSELGAAWYWGLFSAIVWATIWAGVTLAVLIAGLIFAAVAARQVRAAGDAIVQRPGSTLLAAAIGWFGMTVSMVMLFFTIVGIPMGIGYILFVLPVLWFLGYLVAGTQLGRMVLRSRGDAERPYLAALVGLIILQGIGIIPWFGALVAFLAGVVGSGALLLLAWRSWRGERPVRQLSPVATPAPTPAA